MRVTAADLLSQAVRDAFDVLIAAGLVTVVDPDPDRAAARLAEIADGLTEAAEDGDGEALA